MQRKSPQTTCNNIRANHFEATAHLIPQIDVGLSALHGIASTSVFLKLDASTNFTAFSTSLANPCVTASTDINVGVGAQSSFFSLFDKSVGKSLFDKRFPLFQVRAQGPTIYDFFFVKYFSSLSHDRNALRERIRLLRCLPPL
jgi:hypothetical protein